LNPKWTGKLGLEASDVAWFAAVVKAMGEEKGLAYFRKLAAMKPAVRSGHTLMAELVAAGEIPLALNVYNHSVERLKTKGAPIDWKPLQPAFGVPNGIGVVKQAQHPHAALLFADFILSNEGQRIIQQRGFVPASLKVDSPLNKFKYEFIDPVISLDEWDKWSKLWSSFFLQGQEVKKDAQ
ncbi:MAG: ABC transporter substrate-binding protein, partial [Burkholderiales bacterium]|nr:ABC transporter substrate-binding protein [Burkholderiales bacterium]